MQLNILKAEFNGAMMRRSSKGKSRIKDFWEEILDAHSQNDFHTLERVEEALDFLEADKIYFSDELVLALCLQKYHFNPFDKKSIYASATFARDTLKDKFGWSEINAEEVRRLIVSTLSLATPHDGQGFHYRLMHDLRLVRLALPWDRFSDNMEMVRKEYTALSDREFVTAQLALFNHFYALVDIYSIHAIRETCNKSARENIERYITSLQIQEARMNDSQTPENFDRNGEIFST